MTRPSREALLVFVVAGIGCVLLGGPALVHPGQSYVGPGLNDQRSLAFTLDFVAGRVLHGQLPWGHTDRFGAPVGATLFPADLPEALAMVPVVRAFGAIVAFNVLALLHPALAAVGAWGWLRSEGRPRAGAAVGALALAGHGTMAAGLYDGNPDATPLYLVVGALWAWRSRGAAAAAALVAVAGWCGPYAGVTATFAVLARAAVERDVRAVLAVGAAAAAAAALRVHVEEAALLAADAAIKKGVPVDGVGTAALLDLVRPGLRLLPTDAGWPDAAVATGAYVGLSLVVGALGGRSRRAFGWGLVFLGVVLALGPDVHAVAPPPGGPGAGPPGAGWPGPWRLVARLPGLRELAQTARFSTLAVVGLVWLASETSRAWVPVVVAVDFFVVGGAAASFRASPAWDDGAAELVAPLAPGPVLDLPGTFHELWLAQSLRHGHPVAEGINRPLPVPTRIALSQAPNAPLPALAKLGYRWVVLHDRVPGHPAQRFEVPEACVVAHTDAVRVVALPCPP